jgi:hypothetical protein
MAEIIRMRARWSGFQGGPGYSLFHYRDFDTTPPTNAHATQAATDIRAFYDTIKSFLPPIVKLDVEADCDVIEETTGELIGAVTATPGATVTGTAISAGYAASAGAVVTWKTNGVRNSRRIRGRTFVVPLSSNAYSPDGTLQPDFLTAGNAAAVALADSSTGSPDLGVWARPTPILDVDGNPTGEHNPDGIWYVANGHSIPDMAAVLRSRRD